MSDIVIRELQPEDAEKLIAYIKRIGGETDNLTFGAAGIRKTRYAVPAALCADLAGFFFAALTVRCRCSVRSRTSAV